MKRLRSWFGKARGLGSAKSGSVYWWRERATALALIPLSIWFVVELLRLPFADYAEAVHWLSDIYTVAMMILLLVMTIYHAALGMQVIYEDYIHHEGLKITSILVTKGLFALAGLIAVLSILKVYFMHS